MTFHPRSGLCGLLISGLVGLAIGGPGPALAQGKASPGGNPSPPPAAPSSPAAADPAFEAARAAFEPLPEPDRKAIQDALAWVAGYNSVVSGAFGRRTYESIVAFQRRANLRADGILTPEGRNALFAAAKRARDAVRFSVIADERSGVQIGIPAATLPRREPNANGGTRWQSADGRITLDTRVVPEGEDLPGLYERLTTGEVTGRKITYKVLRPDFLVVAGETGSGRFYIRYASGSAGLRGFSLGYDKAVASGFDPLVIAIANSFQPVAGAPPAVAAVPTPPGRPPQGVPAAPAGPAAGGGPAGSGLVVAPRRVLTAAPVAACTEIRAGRGRARVVAADRAGGLVLLEAEAAAGAPPAPPSRTGPMPADEGVIVLAFSGGAFSGLVAVPGHLDGSGRLLAPLQPGASGGIVLDRSGALAGLVGPLPQAPRQVAGIVPPLAHPVVPTGQVGAFLEAQQIRLEPARPLPSRSAGEIAAPVAGAVVPVACGR